MDQEPAVKHADEMEAAIRGLYDRLGMPDDTSLGEVMLYGESQGDPVAVALRNKPRSDPNNVAATQYFIDDLCAADARAREGAFIRISPRGTGKFTDHGAADRLSRSAPKSLRQAQSVVAAASKYLKGSGWFTSEGSRIQNLQMKSYELSKTLDAEGYNRAGEKDLDKVFRFMNAFASIYPNWQGEYAVLNRMFPEFFRGL